MKIRIYKYLLLVTLILTACENAEKQNIITIGTFNIQWLGDNINDEKTRSETEIQEISNIILSSKIDILALQEIENSAAMERIMPLLSDYKFEILTGNNKQNLAVIYKNNVKITDIKSYKSLAINGNLRPGFMFNAKVDNYEFTAMIVHLKSTSRYDSTAEMKEESREIRLKQAEIISNWADSMMMKAGKMELLILGDFNDYPTRKNNATLTPIIHNPNLHFLTEGNSSCSNPNWLAIDHIVASSTTKKRFVQNSVFTYNFYSALPEKEAEKISDHCPVTIQLQTSYAENSK